MLLVKVSSERVLKGLLYTDLQGIAKKKTRQKEIESKRNETNVISDLHDSQEFRHKAQESKSRMREIEKSILH